MEARRLFYFGRNAINEKAGFLRIMFLCVLGTGLLSGCLPPPAPGGDYPPASDKRAPAGYGSSVPAGQVSPPDASAPLVDDGPVPTTLSARTVKIGVLLPLSGAHGKTGQALFDAAQLALFDKYQRLPAGVEEKARIVLVPKDTEGTQEGARRAAQQALKEGADVLLGPLFSRSVTAIAPLARNAGKPVIAFSNNKQVAGNGVYIMGFLPDQEIERVVAYAFAQGHTKFAAMMSNDLYGGVTSTALQQVIQEYGLELAKLELYPPAEPDASKEVRRIAHFYRIPQFRPKQQIGSYNPLEGPDEDDGKRFTALLIPEGGGRLLGILDNFRSFGFDPQKDTQLLGSRQWDDVTLLRSGRVMGAWIPGVMPQTRQAFERHFYQTYGYAAPTIAAMGYDAGALLTSLALEPSGPDFSPATLTGEAGFRGPVEGLFRFRSDGTAERALAVMEVAVDGLRVIDPAPTRFYPSMSYTAGDVEQKSED